MKVFKIFAVTAFAATLASCASTGGGPEVKKMLAEATGQNGRACVRKDYIQGYGVLKHDIVSIDSRRNYYLATVLPGCTDLQTSMRAFFNSDFYKVCGGKMDKMVTRDNHCVIHQLYEFDSRKEAFATYNSVLEKRREQKNAAPD
jgi:hypothetical protein